MKEIFCWSIATILAILTCELVRADGVLLYVIGGLFGAAGVSLGTIWEEQK